MASLPTDPPLSYSARKTKTFKRRKVQYGEGYSTRAGVGINSIRQVWDLVWNDITDVQEAALDTFFSTQKGVTAFDWTPPNQSTSLKWSAAEYNASVDGYNRWTVRVTVEQEFDA